jgi:hypothetical protein
MTDDSDIGFPRIYKFNKAVIVGPDELVEDCFGDIHFRAPEVL